MIYKFPKLVEDKICGYITKNCKIPKKSSLYDDNVYVNIIKTSKRIDKIDKVNNKKMNLKDLIQLIIFNELNNNNNNNNNNTESNKQELDRISKITLMKITRYAKGYFVIKILQDKGYLMIDGISMFNNGWLIRYKMMSKRNLIKSYNNVKCNLVCKKPDLYRMNIFRLLNNTNY